MSTPLVITEQYLEIEKGTNIVDLINKKHAFQIDFSKIHFVASKIPLTKFELENVNITYNGKPFVIKTVQTFRFRTFNYIPGSMTKQNQRVCMIWKDKEFGKKMVIFNWFVNQAMYFNSLRIILGIKELTTDEKFIQDVCTKLNYNEDFSDYLNRIKNLDCYARTSRDDDDDEPIGIVDCCTFVKAIHPLLLNYLNKTHSLTEQAAELKKYFLNKGISMKFGYMKQLSFPLDYSFINKEKKKIEGTSYWSTMQFKIKAPGKEVNRYMTLLVKGKNDVAPFEEKDFKLDEKEGVSEYINAQMIIIPKVEHVSYLVGCVDGLVIEVNQIKYCAAKSATQGVQVLLDFDEETDFVDEVPADDIIEDSY
jgi:hypothetical protein